MKQYLGWIPPNAKRVLEFGCGTGELGAMFKSVQPQVIYIGIETDSEYIKQASSKLDLVIPMAEGEILSKAIYELAPFDCVIYHQASFGSGFGMDVPLTTNGQVLLFPDSDNYTFPWRLGKGSPKENWDLVTLFSDPVCAFMRMIIPNSFYKTNPAVNVIEMDLGKMLDKTALPQGYPYVLIFQRFLSANIQSAHSIYTRLASYGGLLIHEFDDWPEKWQEKYIGTKYYDFIGVHAVQTTTKGLGEYFRQFNPHVLVFPNELCNLPPQREFDKPQNTVRIFYGAVNRQEEWQSLMPAIREAIRVYGDKIYFNIVADAGFYEALPTTQKKYYGKDINGGIFVPYELYEDALHNSDIALLPLLDTAFNRMKSDLKYIEAAGHGAAVLAAPTVYEDTIEEDRSGLIFRDIKDFQQKLFMLIENRQLRLNLATAAYAYVKHNRLMCQHYEERLALLKELMDRRDELELERQKRVADLKLRIGMGAGL